MKLNTLKAEGWNKIKWCGPTALAIITGRTLKYCHNKLARLAWKEPRYLKGTGNGDMIRALREMGYLPSRVDDAWHKTLRQYIEEVQNTEHFRGVMLVNVTNHYVVISKGMVADNHCSKPIPVREHPSWRKRIAKAWIIRKK